MTIQLTDSKINFTTNSCEITSSAGAININNKKLTGVATPTASSDVATKQYVDDNSGGGGSVDTSDFVLKSGTSSAIFNQSIATGGLTLANGNLQLSGTNARIMSPEVRVGTNVTNGYTRLDYSNQILRFRYGANASGIKLGNLLDATAADQAVSQSYGDSRYIMTYQPTGVPIRTSASDSNPVRLKKTGASGSCSLYLQSNNNPCRLEIGNPVFTTDGAPKAYVDAQVSDISLKENIVDIENDDRFDNLRPVKFNWKQSETQYINELPHNGFIAQEVEQLYPEMIGMVDGVKGIQYVQMIALLVKEVQQLKLEVAELKNN